MCSWTADRLWVKTLLITAVWSRPTMLSGSGRRSAVTNRCYLGFVTIITSCSSSPSHRQVFIDSRLLVSFFKVEFSLGKFYKFLKFIFQRWILDNQIIYYEVLIIPAKWTEWMAKILFTFDVCVRLCLCVRARRPVWALNANSSKTAKATDFKFNKHVSCYYSVKIHLAEICIFTIAF